MKQMSLMILVCLSMSLSFASDRIEKFGYQANGANDILDSQLPESFYYANQIKAIASGRNFHAMIDLAHADAVLGKMDLADEADLADLAGTETRELTLVNHGKRGATIVVSAVADASDLVNNFVINLGPEATLDLDLASLNGFDTLYLISSSSFEAYRNGETALTVNAPTVAKSNAKTFDYCFDWSGDMTIENQTTHATVNAVFERNAVGSKYYLYVYYPYYPTLFHDGTGGTLTLEACKMKTYTTHSPVSGKNLLWKNALSLYSGFDEVVFFGSPGQATCSSSCGGDTTTYGITCY